MMNKKILIVTDNLPNQVNGVVTTFKNLEIQANKDGYEVVYINPSLLPHISCPGYPEVKLSWPFIGKIIRKIDPYYIHIATEGPLGLATRIYCDLHNLKYNTSYHTKLPEYMKEIYGIPLPITYAYVRWFHKHSGKVLTTTKTMVNDLIDHGFKSNIIPWTRGVDRDTLKPTQEHINCYIGLKPVVLYVGRVSKEKNLDVLCELQDKYNIWIVGDGPYTKELKSKYPNVTFFGYQSGTELANSYIKADVFCFPSKTDTFGIVIIEALSVGTPVAAFSVPGPIDIIEQGLTGYMGDDLSQNIELCLRLNRKSVRLASQKWTWEECWNIFKSNLLDI
jgi:glycosyltransferase involved in cell wall biosynthesis